MLEKLGADERQAEQCTARKLRFDLAEAVVIEYEVEEFDVVWSSMSEDDDGACLAGIMLLLLGPGPHLTVGEQVHSAKAACPQSVFARAAAQLKQVFEAMPLVA